MYLRPKLQDCGRQSILGAQDVMAQQRALNFDPGLPGYERMIAFPAAPQLCLKPCLCCSLQLPAVRAMLSMMVTINATTATTQDDSVRAGD